MARTAEGVPVILMRDKLQQAERLGATPIPPLAPTLELLKPTIPRLLDIRAGEPLDNVDVDSPAWLAGHLLWHLAAVGGGEAFRARFGLDIRAVHQSAGSMD